MTKKSNKKYEDRLVKEGLKKITLWVPKDTVPDFKLMAIFCREHKDHTPYMVRNLVNGQMAKAI